MEPFLLGRAPSLNCTISYLRQMDFSFPKSEHLCSKIIFSELMNTDKGFNTFPLRVVWKELPLPTESNYQIAFSVSKRRFKKATDRNRMKRLMREAWRHQKATVISEIEGKQCAFLVIYLSSEPCTFDQMNVAFQKMIEKWKVQWKAHTV